MNNNIDAQSRPLKGKAGQLISWIDTRTGSKSMLRKALEERIPGGARAAYVFGSGLLFIFLLQVITGVSLALYYTPTAETAHTSVAYITKQVAGGAFLRSLHSYGSSAMIIVLCLHFLQTFFYGSFKGRREILWLAGAVLSFLVLGMGFTGYLLPWDQKAYFATAVGTNVAGQVPFVGELITRFLRGGDTIGTLTISRFYLAHIFLLPASIVFFVVAHIVLFRKAGPAGPMREDPISPKLHSEAFYPRQLLYDMAFALIIVAGLAALAYLRPVTLGPIANPADSHFLPRPEWYYLPMFEWLKFWEGPAVVIGIVVVPGIIAAAFFLLPFLDRGLERRPWRRPIPAFAVSIVVAGMVYLGVKSQIEDHQGPVAAQLAQQRADELAYSAAPFEPYSTEPQRKLITAGFVTNPLVARGKGIFIEKGCTGCHGQTGTGSANAPSLIGVNRKYGEQQIIELLQNPNQRMKAAGMPSVDPQATDVHALLAFIEVLGTPTANVKPEFGSPHDTQSTPAVPSPARPSLSRAAWAVKLDPEETSGAAALSGQQIFQERGCFACHGKEGAGGRAPALAPLVSKLSDSELKSVLRRPNDRMQAGGMPPVDVEPGQLDSLVAYLRSLRAPVMAVRATEETRKATPSLQVSSEHTMVASLDPPPPPSRAGEPAPSDRPASPGIASPVDAGRAIFRSQGCIACHGTNGQGSQVAPSLAGVTTRFPGDALGNLLRHPRPKMRAAGMPTPQVDDAGMSQLVAYLSSLNQPSAAVITEAEPAQPEATGPGGRDAPVSDPKPAANRPAATVTQSAVADPRVKQGLAVFHKYSCETCHGTNGLRGTTAAPGLAGTASELPASTLEGLLRHHSDRMKNGGMPATNFNAGDMAAVVAYIRSLSPDGANRAN